MAVLVIDLAAQGLQHQRFNIVADIEHHLVNVGVLVAFGINLPVVGIAFGAYTGRVFAIARGDLPSPQVG